MVSPRRREARDPRDTAAATRLCVAFRRSGARSIAVLAALPGSSAAATTAPKFAPPVYVDQQLAGGEPEVFADVLHGRLIYTLARGHDASLPRRHHELAVGRLRVRLELLQPGQHLDVARRRRELVPRPVPRHHVPAEPDVHRVQRPRPDPGRGRPRLQHRHRPRQRRASSRRWTAARRGTRAPATATTATGRGSPAASPTRSSWAPTRSRAAAAATRSSSPPTAATRAARPASPTTGRSPTAARGRRSGSSTTTS